MVPVGANGLDMLSWKNVENTSELEFNVLRFLKLYSETSWKLSFVYFSFFIVFIRK